MSISIPQGINADWNGTLGFKLKVLDARHQFMYNQKNPYIIWAKRFCTDWEVRF